MCVMGNRDVYFYSIWGLGGDVPCFFSKCLGLVVVLAAFSFHATSMFAVRE